MHGAVHSSQPWQSAAKRRLIIHRYNVINIRSLMFIGVEASSAIITACNKCVLLLPRSISLVTYTCLHFVQNQCKGCQRSKNILRVEIIFWKIVIQLSIEHSLSYCQLRFGVDSSSVCFFWERLVGSMSTNVCVHVCTHKAQFLSFSQIFMHI